MSKVLAAVISVFLCICLLVGGGLFIFFNFTPTGIEVKNNYFSSLHKADDNTKYKNLKEVEDTCRAMIASYNADKLIYEQYRAANDSEKLSWAEEAKMRANQTASTYNNYIIKNGFIWEKNVPADIYMSLEFIE